MNKFRTVLATIILLIIVSCGESDMQKTFSNDNYSIEYPESWDFDDSGKFNTKFLIYSNTEILDGFRENVNFTIQNLPEDTTLKQFVEGTKQQLSQIPKSKIIKSNIIKLNNKDVFEIVWQGYVTNNDLKFKQHCYLEDNKAHIVTFTAKQDTYEKYEEKASKILNSFILK
ncbi:PsbP-related protein [Winogradskyella sp. R77965]|uniref:PsbP-related protein n=1 Tax=Winogradskyella sp. R77965 TaxID=3093872 RepID=UPI0037DD0B2C